MKKIIALKDFDVKLDESLIDIDIKIEDDSDVVLHSLEGISGIEVKTTFPFGVINAKAPKEKIEQIKDLPGVESVEITKSK